MIKFSDKLVPRNQFKKMVGQREKKQDSSRFNYNFGPKIGTVHVPLKVGMSEYKIFPIKKPACCYINITMFQWS